VIRGHKRGHLRVFLMAKFEPFVGAGFNAGCSDKTWSTLANSAFGVAWGRIKVRSIFTLVLACEARILNDHINSCSAPLRLRLHRSRQPAGSVCVTGGGGWVTVFHRTRGWGSYVPTNQFE
jgi:hypothetical protein